MAKNPRKKEGVSIESYDNANYKATDAYAAIIQRLFDRTTEIIAQAAARGTIDSDKPFSFADYPQLRTIMEDATNELANNMQGVIAKGTRKQWEYAGKKCDAFLASIIDTSKLSKKQLEQMRLRSLSALSAFQERKVGGMNLSQRVWKYVDQYKQQLEEALDVGLGEGRSAAQLARDVRQNLVEPNRLFRRVRDKRGNLQLSRNAAAYHPGQGVYRSSVKNAQRLTRSEINMAYRESDWQRWQSLDFVVGFEVVRSNHEPEYHCDLCDRLAGRYPKTFKFLGWHPQCRCHAVPIMADYFSKDASNDRIARMRAALYGTEYKKYVPKETITDLPDGFKAYRKEMIAKQKALPKGKKLWKEPPYFIRDNFEDGDITKDFIRSAQAKTVDQVEPMKMALSALPKEQQNAIRNRINNLELGEELEDACYWYKISTQHWVDMAARAYDDPENNWQLVDECDAEKKRLESECDRRAATDMDLAKRLIGELQGKILEAKKWDNDAAESSAKMWKAYCDHFNQEKAKRWGDYTAIVAVSCQRQIDGLDKVITQMQSDWADVKSDAKKVVDAATDKSTVATMAALANETPRNGRDAKTIIKEIKDAIIALKRAQTGIHPGMKTDYPKNADVDDSIKAINDEMKAGERWLEHGDCQLAIETNPNNNGSTDMKGRIWLTTERLKHVRSAMAKIGQGKGDTITFDEADAMATFWREITHNRNVPGNMYITDVQRRYMELANEFVARHSLDDFYKALGCANPHPEFKTNRKSTGYNEMVTNYDYVIDKCGLDSGKIFDSVRSHLYTAKYDDQATGLKQGLVDGGLKYVGGKKKGKAIGKGDLTSLVKLIKDTRGTTIWDADAGKWVTKTKEQIIDEWLIEHDLILPPK